MVVVLRIIGVVVVVFVDWVCVVDVSKRVRVRVDKSVFMVMRGCCLWW